MTNRKDTEFSLWVDVLKGLAIFEIVMFHFFADHGYATLLSQKDSVHSNIDRLLFQLKSWAIQATHVGSQGIHVFFFMSGLGLAASGIKNQVSVKEFLRKRLSRNYPGFYVGIVLVLALQISTGEASVFTQ